jgi:hypothetical protein
MIDGARREVADGTAGPETRRHIKKNNLFKYVLRCGPTFDKFVKNCTEKQWVGNCYYSFTFNQLRACADRLATFHTCRFSERLSGLFITH